MEFVRAALVKKHYFIEIFPLYRTFVVFGHTATIQPRSQHGVVFFKFGIGDTLSGFLSSLFLRGWKKDDIFAVRADKLKADAIFISLENNFDPKMSLEMSDAVAAFGPPGWACIFTISFIEPYRESRSVVILYFC